MKSKQLFGSNLELIRKARIIMIQAVLNWKDFNNLLNAITGNEYNTEDMMSIPTSLTRKAPVAVTEDIIEFALAA